MQMIIRRATSADGTTTAELYLRARRAGAAKGAIPPLVHEDEDVRAWVTKVVVTRLECWLAAPGPETIVGLLMLKGDWINQLYVDPDLTGGGIGTELIAVAKRERPDRLRLWTFVSNEGAQRFYLRPRELSHLPTKLLRLRRREARPGPGSAPPRSRRPRRSVTGYACPGGVA